MSGKVWLWRACLGAWLLVAAAASGAAFPPLESGGPNALERVRYYEDRIERDPAHYPSHAQLGGALLDLARENLDPEAVRRARRALQTSLDLQVNFEALKTTAALENFAHRFDRALEFAKRAEAAFPEDKELLALQTDALIGQGRLDDVKALLAPRRAGDFHTAAARAAFHAAGERIEEAVAGYIMAAESASRQNAEPLRTWALARAAGVLIDRGVQLQRAESLLARAAESSPEDRLVRLHQAELAAARGETAQAAEIGLRLLRETDTPELRSLLADWTRALGRTEEAREHFLAAEAVYRPPVDAGEAYTLTALAALYCRAGMRLEEAEDLLRKARRSGQADRHLEAAERCLQSRGG